MSFWTSTPRKARKEHHCLYCGKVIHVGETYSREKGMAIDGEFCYYPLCSRCADVWDELHDGWDDSLGDFQDDLFDNDLVLCPFCGSAWTDERDCADDMQSITCTCGKCGKDYTLDLSAEAILKTIGDRRKK